MPRGPLPDPNRRRTNAPTIPTTNLPASGRKGRLPKSPLELGDAGAAWWRWAWRLPQACGWSVGDLYAIARRAHLEDVLAEAEPGARLGTAREMRELDDRFGLTPKGMAALRWKIVADSEPAAVAPAGVTSLDARRSASIAS